MSFISNIANHIPIQWRGPPPNWKYNHVLAGLEGGLDVVQGLLLGTAIGGRGEGVVYPGGVHSRDTIAGRPKAIGFPEKT